MSHTLLTSAGLIALLVPALPANGQGASCCSNGAGGGQCVSVASCASCSGRCTAGGCSGCGKLLQVVSLGIQTRPPTGNCGPSTMRSDLSFQDAARANFVFGSTTPITSIANASNALMFLHSAGLPVFDLTDLSAVANNYIGTIAVHVPSVGEGCENADYVVEILPTSQMLDNFGLTYNFGALTSHIFVGNGGPIPDPPHFGGLPDSMQLFMLATDPPAGAPPYPPGTDPGGLNITLPHGDVVVYFDVYVTQWQAADSMALTVPAAGTVGLLVLATGLIVAAVVVCRRRRITAV